MKKVIIAGAGHGGLITAINLAKNGFDVTVIEKRMCNKLGYNWKDVFDINELKKAGVEIPAGIKLEKSDKMIFYSPTLNFKRYQTDVSDNNIKMNRKVLYKILIKNAKKSGVKFIFGKKILYPLFDNDKVVGVKTLFSSYYADLVIDACGVNSVIRRNLKKECEIEKNVKSTDIINIYRACYKKIKNIVFDEKYKIYLFPNDSKGISWVEENDKYIDILIGKMYPINKKSIKDDLIFLRQNNKFSNFILSGGSFEKIPVRKPLSQLVWNGYVAIGDSAFMTIPLIGSGINLCAKAAKILSEVLIKNKDLEYNIFNLWEYQYRFFREIGYDLVFKSVLKDLFLNLSKEEIDYIFQYDIITNEMITEIIDDDKLEFDINDLVINGKKGIKNPKLILKLGKALADAKKKSVLCKAIPIKYDRKLFKIWKKIYLK